MASMEGSTWQAKRLRANKLAQEAEDLARYGEEELERRKQAKRAIADERCQRINPIVDDARRRGFGYFRSLLDLRKDGIRLQFADGKGTFYERMIGYSKLSNKHNIHLLLHDRSDIENSVHSYVRGMDGIGMLDHGMTATRVRATWEH
jgi:hypothetical protein